MNNSFKDTDPPKWPIALGSLLMLILLAWPVGQNRAKQPVDDFPLSYYPMFSHQRDTSYGLYYIVGYDSLRQRYTIPYEIIGSGGFNQVRRQINRQAKNGQGDQLLETVAQRLAAKKSAPWQHIQAVKLVKGYYHLERFFEPDGKLPLREKIIAQQPVIRP
jgi:hypothetical protein